MSGVIEDLLLNLLFILIFLVIIPLLLEQSYLQIKYKKIIFCVSACLAIIACMTFPLAVDEETIYDLRFTGTVIGSLYGGYMIAVILWLVTIAFRFFFGGIGIFSTIIIATFLLLLTVYLHPKFQAYSKRKKMIVASCITFITSICTNLFITFVHNISIGIENNVISVIIATISTLVVIYIKEFIHETSLLKKDAIKSEKMAIVSQLASSISHEVKNPLTVVKGFLQLMVNSELSRKKQLEYLNLSIKELDKANNIITRYLTFAKPTPENRENLNIKHELETIIELITPLANMNGVKIKANLHSYWFRGDKQLFQQCMINITKNCIEAMPNGGLLTIHSNGSFRRVVIEIMDTGVGMTSEELNRIGEPYYTTKGDEGTGLGMLTSLNIIESMNGSFYIESEKNKGTKFTIIFPMIDIEEKT